jgi:hypothetical protein
MRLMRGPLFMPLLLAATTVACALVAAVVGSPAWAAAVGAGLVLGYWALEQAVWRRARRRPGLALGTAIGGMLVRIILVLAVLVVVGLLARPAFAATALSFLAAFTLYGVVRLFAVPAAEQPAERAQTS